MKDMIRVKGPNEVPEGPHFMVIIYDTTSVYVPGDERSRTNPGHGYPEHTDTFDTFEQWVTDDQAVLNDFIRALDVEVRIRHKQRPYVVLKVEKKARVVVEPEIRF